MQRGAMSMWSDATYTFTHEVVVTSVRVFDYVGRIPTERGKRIWSSLPASAQAGVALSIGIIEYWTSLDVPGPTRKMMDWSCICRAIRRPRR
ncbi:hypothetical protein SAMN06265784_12064 [Paraburkholderia susongensis]|uniref:Uncharacterized protein n=1 Tax=Paraburkholderia susongensis TaxID=1515439 RepID=A0A1X7M6A3_9BURK|nr:hypothetical protein SAMN06265784_12064 [Paraburkholderia susongensis]